MTVLIVIQKWLRENSPKLGYMITAPKIDHKSLKSCLVLTQTNWVNTWCWSKTFPSFFSLSTWIIILRVHYTVYGALEGLLGLPPVWSWPASYLHTGPRHLFLYMIYIESLSELPREWILVGRWELGMTWFNLCQFVCCSILSCLSI